MCNKNRRLEKKIDIFNFKGFSDFNITYEEDSQGNSVPIITLEPLSDSSTESCPSTQDNENSNDDSEQQPNQDYVSQNTGVHFLTEKPQEEPKPEYNDNRDADANKEPEMPQKENKYETVEYITRSDGSVVCKMCGEILQSRTHWYRHKYKFHVAQPLNPTPLFQCEQCLVYFKSRKGYIGHLSSRHSEVLSDSSPVLTNAQIEAMAKNLQLQQPQSLQLQVPQPMQEVKEDMDPEMAIPTSAVPNYQASVVKQNPVKSPEAKKVSKTTTTTTTTTTRVEPFIRTQWDEKRTREEKLVADIIDRVRRECEAQGSGGPARRGYTRRTTVMHT